MTTWQRSVPSNPTIQTPRHNHLTDEGSLSDLPEPLEEETLEYQEEYPRGVVEEAEEVVEEEGAEEEEFLMPHPLPQPTQETSLSAICRSHSQGTAQNQKRS